MHRKQCSIHPGDLQAGFSGNSLKSLYIAFYNFTHYATIFLLSLPIPTTEGGASMEYIISLIISVIAGIISHYICKRLDGKNCDN